MKTLNQYINEFLVKGHTAKTQEYKYFPKTKEELEDIIKERVKSDGLECDLNDIDTSKIIDMSNLFSSDRYYGFNGDISKWDVSNVEDMYEMFDGCSKFNSDISEWDTSKVTNMSKMFKECHNFNQDISSWNTSKVTNMGGTFYSCVRFNQDISSWDVSNVKNMTSMFYNCYHFDQDLSSWNVSKVERGYMHHMFDYCNDLHVKPSWYKE